MSEPRPSHATVIARRHLGLSDDVPVTARPVWSPERDDPWYELIEFGSQGAIIAVAAVEIASGTILGAAKLPGTGRHLEVDESAALQRAGDHDALVRLVWAPSSQSRSPLYPIWEVTSGGTRRFVAQGGEVSSELDPAGRGGG